MHNTIPSALVAVYTPILIAVGIALIYIGMRVPPSPFLGAKIGYAYTSRRLLREANIVFQYLHACSSVQLCSFTT